MTSRRLVALAVGLAVGVAAWGCGPSTPSGPPIGTPATTHGKVTFPDGTALKGGIVTFTPVDPAGSGGSGMRFEASGLVDDKGQYTAGLNGDGKGLVPGEYKVTVNPRELGELPGSNSKRIPAAWKDKASTPLTVTIENKDNTVDIVLK